MYIWLCLPIALSESFTEMDALSKRLATEAYGWPAVLGSGGPLAIPYEINDIK